MPNSTAPQATSGEQGPCAGRTGLALSFEFFPPRSPAAEIRLWREIGKLEALAPRFVSVTCGAGGSTQDATLETVTRIQGKTGLASAAHLTCVGAPAERIDRIAAAYWEAGVKHVVALRGDSPATGAGGAYQPHPGGYAYAVDLVAGLKRIADFEISVAAYPEIHPEAASPAQDLDNLKRKIDAGATRAITQFFFDPDVFLRYLDRVRGAGIVAPVVAGIMPILDFARTCGFAKHCGVTIPDWLAARFEGLDENPAARGPVAAAAAAEQCRQLRARGVTEFHFYTLNRADLTTAVCRDLQNPVLSAPDQGLDLRTRSA